MIVAGYYKWEMSHFRYLLVYEGIRLRTSNLVVKKWGLHWGGNLAWTNIKKCRML